ncbi:hypothetical protein QBC40DRAFT_348434 [Triangularia verruculosa]|uniref:GPI anchored protein n=1 Tax=Triangularia verruculosa TaxID=2587418 RepID=A0AAN6XHI5_9PEZI|nr:hypothetical protein QBC40DRAFT_348434 [Triangularia verruculosa]
MRPLPLPLWTLISAHLSLASQQPPQSPLQQPTAIRKMPPNNPSLKFHAHFCAFDASSSSNSTLHPRDSSSNSFSAPLRAIYDPQPTSPNPARRGVLLSKRQWSCPTDTRSCSNIGYPNTCCYDGSSCIKVPDTGLGPVGCCPDNTQCTGGVTSCGEGGIGCPSEVGGGCCLKGWVCGGLGCVKEGIISTPIPIPTTTTTLPETTASSTPVSSSTPLTTTTEPTSSSTTSEDTEPSTTEEPQFCPTGYYACLARENVEGGCCQIGRDCASTDCPPLTSSTTVVDGNGVTVVVPVPTAAPPVMGGNDQCARGWFMCNEKDEGEGCCPEGYGCGAASCTLVRAGETAGVAKALPGTAGGAGRQMGGFVGGMMGVVGMVMAF